MTNKHRQDKLPTLDEWFDSIPSKEEVLEALKKCKGTADSNINVAELQSWKKFYGIHD